MIYIMWNDLSFRWIKVETKAEVVGKKMSDSDTFLRSRVIQISL